MQVSDARGVHFDPEQIAILSQAYQQAVASMKSWEPLSEETKSTVAKVIVSLGRQKLRAHQPFDAGEISARTAEFLRGSPSMIH